jgi:predicted dehydrogenase
MSHTRRRFLQKASGLGAAAWAAPLVGASLARAAEEPNARKIGIALVGLGKLSAGQLAPALQKTKLCRLTGLVSGSPEKAREWAKQYGVPEKNIYNYENFDAIKDNPDIDIVYVVLPNSMHAEYTIRAAKAGKHVLCEKPMAVSAKECEQMIAACKQAKRQLAIGYRLRFEPFNLEMMRLSRERVFGPVKVIEAAAGFRIGDPTQWRLKKAMAGGGSMLDVGVYSLQAARYISGEEPTSVSAQWSKTDAEKFKDVEEETIQFTLKFPSGAVANCTGSYATRLSRWLAAAENGWFELAPAFGYGPFKGRTSGPDGTKDMELENTNHFQVEMDDFADCILNGRPTTVPGEEGLRDLRIVEAVYQAAGSGRTVALV